MWPSNWEKIVPGNLQCGLLWLIKISESIIKISEYGSGIKGRLLLSGLKYDKSILGILLCIIANNSWWGREGGGRSSQLLKYVILLLQIIGWQACQLYFRLCLILYRQSLIISFFMLGCYWGAEIHCWLYLQTEEWSPDQQSNHLLEW